jgi:hypothetical protein
MSETPTVTLEASELAKRLIEVRNAEQKLEAELNVLKGEEEQIKMALKDHMERLGLRNFKMADGSTVYLEARFFIKVPDPEKGIVWLDEHGLGDVAPRTINRARLNETYKDRTAEDQPLPPPEIMEATSLVTVKVRSPK